MAAAGALRRDAIPRISSWPGRDTAVQDPLTHTWWIRDLGTFTGPLIEVVLPAGEQHWIRVRKVSPVQTKRGAAQYEREVRAAVLSRSGAKEEKRKPARTFATFAGLFIDTYATTNNRPSTVREKRRALGRGLLDEVKELLGHASLEMTMRYAHLSPSARRRAVELLDGATEGHHGGTEKPQDS